MISNYPILIYETGNDVLKHIKYFTSWQNPVFNCCDFAIGYFSPLGVAIMAKFFRAAHFAAFRRLGCADNCGECIIVDNYADFKVKFVDDYPDLRVRFSDRYPGIK